MQADIKPGDEINATDLTEPVRVELLQSEERDAGGLGWFIPNNDTSEFPLFLMDDAAYFTHEDFTMPDGTKVILERFEQRSYYYVKSVKILEDQITNFPEFLKQPYSEGTICTIPNSPYRVRIADGFMEYCIGRKKWVKL